MLRPSAFDCEINMSYRTFNKFWIYLFLPFISYTHFPLFIKDAGLFFVFCHWLFRFLSQCPEYSNWQGHTCAAISAANKAPYTAPHANTGDWSFRAVVVHTGSHILVMWETTSHLSHPSLTLLRARRLKGKAAASVNCCRSCRFKHSRTFEKNCKFYLIFLHWASS